MSKATGTVTTIMHDTVDLDGAVAFWTLVLGLEVLQRDDRYAYLSRISPDGPHLSFQLVPEAKSVKNRIHLDVRVQDRQAFCAWIIELGGTMIAEHQEGAFPTWNVMADPQGNEFCVYAPKVD